MKGTGGTEMPQLAKVREHMDTHVPTVPPDMPILDAARFLIRQRVTGAPVVSAAGKLVGILTELDCLKVLTTEGGDEARHGKVSQYMTDKVVTIPPDMNISYATGVFLRSNFRRLIVVEDGKVVGAITRFDILRFMANSLK